MAADESPAPRQSALQTAEELRDELEALAESDLPFALDAEKILKELEESDNK